jgi:Na+-transporting NADH:ubiquinone oxidoreductase subunit A
MRHTASKASLTLLALVFANAILAQSGTAAAGSGSSWVIYTIMAIAVLVFFFIVVQVSDNLLAIEAKAAGVDTESNNLSLMPSWNELFQPKKPDHLADKQVTYLKQGHDILLEGEAIPVIDESVHVATFAVQPTNFVGISPIPKMQVEVGAEVKAGDILFIDKKNPDWKWAAPVSGEVIAVNRGAKRAIIEVVILADKEQTYREVPAMDIDTVSRENLVSHLQEYGAWPMIRQRPFNVMAASDDMPRDIFVSTFDSAPLAADQGLVVEGREAAFQKGLDVLNKLTEGTVYLGLDARGDAQPHRAFTEASGVETRWFHGKHPSGNVGVQIHHIHPIATSDKVWTLGVQEVITLGSLFTEQRFNTERVVALTGAELKEAKYVRTHLGANINDLLKGNVASNNVRYISGDVLSGQKKSTEQFLNFFDDQITVVEEGDDYELFGWLLPSFNTPSVSNTFPSAILPSSKFKANTNTHGEKRAFVVTGLYEEVLPMDIYPQNLFKSILIGDFEQMEGLGLHELVEEDVALCEFVCISKQPIQEIVRRGLDMMREQS